MVENKIIETIQKNKSEKYIISCNEYGGHKFVDLRIWYRDSESGEYKPSKKGIAIKPGLGKQIIEALQKATNEIIADEVEEAGKDLKA